MELRDEPPAVVNLLVNRLAGAGQAASATLLDLAARRVVEFHEVADDPEHTLVRLGAVALPAQAPAFERSVVARVERVAGRTWTPVSRLVEAHAEGSRRWQQRLVRDVILDARRRGLIRTDEPGCAPALLVAAVVSAALLAPLVPRHAAWPGPATVALAAAWLVLSLGGGFMLAFVSGAEKVSTPDRYTPAGRRATAHWLGVADWLRAHESLRDLPPAAVAVWDRYLAYGAALNTSRHAVRVLDFETVGRRDVLWSTHTGQRRQVRVRYWGRSPLWPFGRVAARARLTWALVTLPVWVAAGLVVASGRSGGYPQWLLLTLLGIEVLWCAFRIVHAGLDLARPVQLTGTVLDIGVGTRQRSADQSRPGMDLPDLPTFYLIVVDDGRSDVLVPWIVNRDIARGTDIGPPPVGADPQRLAAWHEALVRPFFEPGDRVRLTGQRRSRFVTALQ